MKKEVIATSDIWSGEALESIREFDLEVQHLTTELGKGRNALIVGLLPGLTTVVVYIRTDVLPAFKDFRDKALVPLRDFIVDDLIPTLGDLHLMLQDNIEPVFRATGDTIRTLLNVRLTLIWAVIDQLVLPALKALWTYLGEDIKKVFETVSPIVQDFAEKALMSIKTVWENDVKPALEDLRDFTKDTLIPTLSDLHVEIRDNLEPVIDATGETIRTILVPKMKAIQLIVDNVVLPALEALWKYFGEEILEVFEKVKASIEYFTDTVLPAIKTVWEDKVRPALTGIWATLTTAVEPAIEGVKDEFNLLTEAFAVGAAGMRGDTKELQKDTLTDFGAIHQSVDDDLKGPFSDLTDFVWPLVIETWEEHLKPTFQAIVDFIRDVLFPIIGDLKDEFIKAWSITKVVVKAIVKSLFLSIETSIGTATATIRILLAVMQGDWDKAWQGIKDFAEEIWEQILGLLDAWGIDFEKIWKGIWESIKEEFHKATDPIIGFINDILEKVRTVKTAIRNIPSPSGIAGRIGGALGAVLGKIPGFAGGVQNFSGGLAKVHEGEVITNLPRGTNVIPAGAGDGGVNIIFNGPVYGVDDFNEKVNQARLAWQRAGNA